MTTSGRTLLTCARPIGKHNQICLSNRDSKLLYPCFLNSVGCSSKREHRLGLRDHDTPSKAFRLQHPTLGQVLYRFPLPDVDPSEPRTPRSWCHSSPGRKVWSLYLSLQTRCRCSFEVQLQGRWCLPNPQGSGSSRPREPGHQALCRDFWR